MWRCIWICTLKKFGGLLECCNKYCIPRGNIIFERYCFNSRLQQLGERVDQFITDFHTLSEFFEFISLREKLIRDRILAGMSYCSLHWHYKMGLWQQGKPKCFSIEEQYFAKVQKLCNRSWHLLVGTNVRMKRRLLIVILMETEIQLINKVTKCYFCGIECHPREKCSARRAGGSKWERIGN